MSKAFGGVCLLSLASTLLFAQSAPSFGQVRIDNVLSPFSNIQIGTGSPRAVPSTSQRPRRAHVRSDRCSQGYRDWRSGLLQKPPPRCGYQLGPTR